MAAREAAVGNIQGAPGGTDAATVAAPASGLAATASLWAPVEAAYDWVFRAAAILANVAGLSGSAVKASYRGLLGAMARHAERVRGPRRGVASTSGR